MKDLPSSQDEMWEGKKIIGEMKPITLCPTHTKENWLSHVGYTQDKFGISCTECGWGTRVPGYYRVQEGKVKDLRTL